MRKRRKERKRRKKRQGGAVVGEEKEGEEEEEGEFNSEEIFRNISEVAEGGFFEGMFSDFIEKIQNIEMPSFEFGD